MSQNLYTSIRGFRVWYKADYEKRDAMEVRIKYLRNENETFSQLNSITLT